MSLTIVTPAKVTALTTVARVKTEIGISGSGDDAFLDTLVRQATDIAEKFCSRVFARQRYSETGPAFGGPYHLLRRAPVIVLHSATVNNGAVTDVSISDGPKGMLYRQNGFDWTAQRFGGLLAAGSFLAQGFPISLAEEPDWAFNYTAGFILPGQNLLSVSTVSASNADNSFNDSASGFPAQLKAGDIIETSGFTNAANNGRHVVTGTPTAGKITVETTLTTENAAAGRTVLVSNLPGDVERGAIEIVKSLYAQRSVDSSIVERQAGVMRIRHSESRAEHAPGLPPNAVGLLRPWVRRVA